MPTRIHFCFCRKTVSLEYPFGWNKMRANISELNGTEIFIEKNLQLRLFKEESDICLEWETVLEFHVQNVTEKRGRRESRRMKTGLQYLFRFHSRPNYFQPRISIEKRIGRKSDRPAICRKPRRSCFLGRDNIWSSHSSTEADVGPSNLGRLPCPCRSSHMYGTRSNRGDSLWVPHGPVSPNPFGTFSLSHHFRICHLSRANEAVNEIEICIYFCVTFLFFKWSWYL